DQRSDLHPVSRLDRRMRADHISHRGAAPSVCAAPAELDSSSGSCATLGHRPAIAVGGRARGGRGRWLPILFSLRVPHGPLSRHASTTLRARPTAPPLCVLFV